MNSVLKRVFAEVITIGDEILIGQVTDTNSAWLGRNLNPAGIEIRQTISVSDQKEHIIDAIDEAWKKVDILILTGGLGPTRDDITKTTLAEYFGATLRQDEKALEMIRELFSNRNQPLLDINEQQALLPDNCTPLYNESGTAPGMWFEKEGKILVSLPGVPHEMEQLMRSQVIPRLRERFSLPLIHHRTILTSGIGESYLSKKIEAIELALPAHIKLAYLPNFNTVRLRFSGHGTDSARLDAELNTLVDAVQATIPNHVAATEDVRLEEVIGQALVKANSSVATAESCTGGTLAQMISSVPGSSRYFLGSVVAYANKVKSGVLGVKPIDLETHGAVSEPVAIQMAEGIRKLLNAEYSIATTGIAGPEGGSEEKPVGTVWIAVSSPARTEARVFHFRGDRQQVVTRSAMMGLDMLRKLLLTSGE